MNIHSVYLRQPEPGANYEKAFMAKRMVFALALSAVVIGASAANAANLIENGGFEGGAYAATDSNNGDTNYTVPVDWVPDNGFIDYASFNRLIEPGYNSPTALAISDYDQQNPGDPLATLSQSFNDVAGANYTVSFYAYDGGSNGDPNAYLTVSAGGASTTLDDTVSAYTFETFTFTGTGRDTLEIAAQTNPNEWYVDDVSVSGVPAGAVPEPAAWGLMLLGLGLVGATQRGKRRGSGSAALAAEG